MGRNNRIIILISILVMIFFISGVIRLFGLRFEKGDIYPAYSSLRSDPLGTKILFESIKIISPLTADRNYQPVYRMESGHDTTLFSLGMDAGSFDYTDRDTYSAISRFVTSGGRLVVSFFPRQRFSRNNYKNLKGKQDQDNISGSESDPDEKAGKEAEAGASGKTEKIGEANKDTSGREGMNFISLEKYWGFQFNYPDEDGTGHTAILAPEMEAGGLPSSLSCHTNLCFDHLDNDWQIIYNLNNQPVIIERGIGKGSIVLSADSYLFSNEALQKERQTGLLAWYIGPNSHIIFDELHFGIQRPLGFSGLVRRYGLHPFFAGLFLIALLYIWKNMVHLVPPSENDPRPEANARLASQDYSAGLISLLRRNIPEKDLLKVGFDEWLKSLGPNREGLKEKIKKIETIVGDEDPETGRSNPVKKYQAICKILAERT